MYLWSWKKLWMLSCIVLVFTACLPQPSFKLSRAEVSQGESVTANLDGLDGTQAKVSVATINAEITDAKENTVTFIIPAAVPEGSQEIIITSGDRTARGTITILSKSAPKFTLNPTQASPGDDVTASLSNLDVTNATVSVAGKEATVKSRSGSALVFTVPDVAAGAQEVVIRSGDKEAKGTLNIVLVPGTFELDRKKAARGETVTATTTGIDLSAVTLVVAQQDVTITPTGENSFTFTVPGDALAGPQTVTLETKAGNLNQSLGILGGVVADKLTILLKPDVTEEELNTVLGRLGFTLDFELNDPFRTLGASDGPCSSAIADIDVNGKPLGQALEELEKEDVALHIDPRGVNSVGSVDHLSAISASIARNNGFTGAGSIIAVLDTGVSFTDPTTSELAGRLLPGFNAINGSTDVTDDFDDANLVPLPKKLQDGIEGHGTPIAVLAAGSTSGVAPGASIMPIKAFGENGVGFSSDVIVGACHALTAAPDLKKLILNLSFGGDTPVDALRAILDYALKNGVQVAAAAGNEGEFDSPAHYPAAFELPELVAVGALQGANLSCVDFDSQNFSQIPYVITDNFIDNDIRVSFKEFYTRDRLGNLVANPNGMAQIAGTSGANSLSTNNINVQFGVNTTSANTYPYPLESVSFSYFDQGGTNNLEVNNDAGNTNLRVVNALSDLNGTTLGGVSVSVTSATLGSGVAGVVRLEGDITQFAIGGQELTIDNICPKNSSAWQPATFSTKGDYVDISAPGAALRSGTPDGNYADAYEGTSFSTPLVAGAMALWKEADTNLSPAQIEANLKRDAIPLPPFGLEEVGAGLLNLNSAPFNVPPTIPLRAGTQ
jgi:subtilisin